MRTKYFYHFIIVFILTGNNYIACCQNFQSVIDDSLTQWDISYHGIPTITTCTFTVSSDSSLINGLIYHKIKGLPWYIREDNGNAYLWFYNDISGEEELLMNLNLSVGDTFLLNPDVYNYQLSIDTIAVVDSVYFYQNQKHIRFNYNFSQYIPNHPFDQDLTFIEGVGPNFGIICQSVLPAYDKPSMLLCAHKKDSTIYRNSALNGVCYYTQVDIEEHIIDSGCEIFPNPFLTYLHIRFHKPQYGVLIISNIIGRELFNQEFNDQVIEINLSGLSPGIYILQVLDYNTNSVVIKKIIKKPCN